MPTARYWRFKVTETSGAPVASAAEFQLYASNDGTGTNLSAGKTSYQSGDAVVGSPSNANDGNVNTAAGSTLSSIGRIFDFTGANQSFVVPAGVTTLDVKMWGGGGAGAWQNYGSSGGLGGAGGFVQGKLAVTPGETLTVIVGGGGPQTSTSVPQIGGFGGGGTGDNGGNQTGGAGGGRSAIRRGSTELATAGGGGGGGSVPQTAVGGAGGGLIGANGVSGGGGTTAGSGGTQTAGGAAGTYTAGDPSTAGSAFQGGNGGGPDGAGGGGGGGYFGGGGGGGSGSAASGGGGGSSYIDGLTEAITIPGSGTTPGNSTDPLRGSAGTGGNSGIAGGNGRVYISWTDPVQDGDPSFDDVSLLLKMEGSNASTTFNDSSANNLTVTAFSAAQISTSDKRFGGSSFWTGGTSGTGYLRIADTPLLIFGTSDFTIEGWFKPSGEGTERTFYIHGINTSGGLTLFLGTGGARFRASGTTDLVADIVIPSSSFTHVAFVRSGNTRRIFINGTQIATDVLSFNVSDAVVTDIGASVQNASDNFRYYGYIDELRITKGLARYTTNFLPPIQQFPTNSGQTPYDPLFANVSALVYGNGPAASTTFTDWSSNQLALGTIGGASVSNDVNDPFGYTTGVMKFDGADDEIRSISTPILALPGDFTIEGWVYAQTQPRRFPTAIALKPSIYISYDHEDAPDKFSVFVSGTRIWGSSTNSGNLWYHVAVVRSGSTVSLYVNGVSVATLQNSTAFGDQQLIIGGDTLQTVELSYLGYVSNVRVTKGNARYLSNFTPPTGPFLANGAVSQTDFLYDYVSLRLSMDGTNGSTAFTDQSINGVSTTASGGAQISTTQSKFGGASGYFDGVAARVSIPASSIFNFGTNPFTIEVWLYRTGDASGVIDCVICNRTSGFLAGNWALYCYNTNIVEFDYRAFGGDNNVVNGTLPLNTWTHVAVTRSGTSLKMYINGVQSSSAVVDVTGPVGDSTTTLSLGSSTDSNFFYQGYIDDLRITKGTTRYTGPFTPPTTALPTSSGQGAKYWRLKNIQVPSADFLEISEIRFLLNGIRQIGTMTSSVAPVGGSINDLNDDNLLTRCYWASSTVESPSFWIQMTFPTERPINGMRQASYDNNTRYMSSFDLEYSLDGVVWVLANSFTNLPYPGNNYTLSSIYAFTSPQTGGNYYTWNVDLGADEFVGSAAIVAPAADTTHAPKDFTVEFSSDQVTWNTIVATLDESAWAGNERRIYSFVVYSVSGVVTDSLGAFAARVVRVYNRATGALVGETTSNGVNGAFSVDVPLLQTNEVQVICLDDAGGGLENDLIIRTFPV